MDYCIFIVLFYTEIVLQFSAEFANLYIAVKNVSCYHLKQHWLRPILRLLQAENTPKIGQDKVDNQTGQLIPVRSVLASKI